MGRIDNTDAYPHDDMPDKEDFLIGTETKGSNNKNNWRTRTFTLETIKEFFDLQGYEVEFVVNQNKLPGEPEQAKIWIGSEAEYQDLVQAGTLQDDTLYYRRNDLS